MTSLLQDTAVVIPVAPLVAAPTAAPQAAPQAVPTLPTPPAATAATPWTDASAAVLATRVKQIRAYVWMHSRCSAWANWYAVLVTVVLCLLNFASGATSLSATNEPAALIMAAGAVSILNGALVSLSKLKGLGFDAFAAAHDAQVAAMNSLWSSIEKELDRPVAARSDLVTLINTTDDQFATLESASEAILPLWVRRECAAAFPPSDDLTKDRVTLPDMCANVPQSAWCSCSRTQK